MNADVRPLSEEIEPHGLRVPEAALRRLRLRLGRQSVTGEAWATSEAYGICPDTVRELLEYWRDGFELAGQELCRLPCFEATGAEGCVRFLHARTRQSAPVPLLLLHGFSGSLVEFSSLLVPLADAGVDVVCPDLADFCWGGAPVSARRVAEACSALMQRLGYTRYAVHGSDLGASLALELGALDGQHVAALHVTELPAYPRDEVELATLSASEKSQLARLTELHEELRFQLPETPIEALAFALARLDLPQNAAQVRQLLTSLTLSWAFGDAAAKAELYRTSRLAAASASQVPIAVHDFPLGAPSLRRFAEREHRIAEWCEHGRGGPMPAWEQPELLLESLREFCTRVR